MKLFNYIKLITLSKSAIGFIAAFSLLFFSCKEEDNDNAFLTLKDNASVLEATASGASGTYTVQSNGKWKIEPLRKEHWLNIEPGEGEGDGTFTITVSENTDEEIRELPLFFTVNGKLQNAVFKVVQEGASIDDGQRDSYIRFDNNLSTSEIPEAGLAQNAIIRATGKWRIEVEDQQDWITFSQSEGEGDTPITLTVLRNTDVERSANLLLFLNNVQQPTPITIAQKGVKLQVVGDLVLQEDFNWLAYGSEIFNVTTGETRISNWSTPELARGWTSTINTTTDGGDYASIYARIGFIKLGRTNYGGDLISPKLINVQRTKNLLVTFKAVRYATGDHYELSVGVNGPGTVSTSKFDVMNVASPNSTLDGSRAAWQATEATYSFVVNGATADTQIWFLGGAFDQRAVSGWPKTTNRIFIDDIVVTVTN